MIKNLILDMGNVLLTYNPQVPLDTFCTTDTEKTMIRKALFDSPIWLDGDRGRIKNAQLYNLAKPNVPEEFWPALKQCCEQWDICMKPIPGAKEFCESMKVKGYRLFVLSNANDKFYDYFERLLPLSFFDGVVVSSDIRIIKPDSRSFQYVLDTYKLQPEECLFVDDSIGNVEAARAMGMQAHRFQNDYEEIINQYAL